MCATCSLFRVPLLVIKEVEDVVGDVCRRHDEHEEDLDREEEIDNAANVEMNKEGNYCIVSQNFPVLAQDVVICKGVEESAKNRARNERERSVEQ